MASVVRHPDDETILELIEYLSQYSPEYSNTFRTLYLRDIELFSTRPDYDAETINARTLIENNLRFLLDSYNEFNNLSPDAHMNTHHDAIKLAEKFTFLLLKYPYDPQEIERQASEPDNIVITAEIVDSEPMDIVEQHGGRKLKRERTKRKRTKRRKTNRRRTKTGF